MCVSYASNMSILVRGLISATFARPTIDIDTYSHPGGLRIIPEHRQVQAPIMIRRFHRCVQTAPRSRPCSSLFLTEHGSALGEIYRHGAVCEPLLEMRELHKSYHHRVSRSSGTLYPAILQVHYDSFQHFHHKKGERSTTHRKNSYQMAFPKPLPLR